MAVSLTASSRVVLIGVSETKELDPIPHADRSREKVKDLLLADDLIGLSQEQIIELPKPGRSSASEVLEDFQEACRSAKDIFMFYFCGHGLYGDDKSPLYLALESSTDKSKQANALKINDLKSFMADSPAPSRVMILDCCYSGAAFQGGMSAENEIRPALTLAGTYAIAAVPLTDKARFIDDDSYTVFSGALIETLENGIESASEYINIDEIFDSVYAKILERGDVALPIKQNSGGAENLSISKNRWARRSAVFNEVVEKISRVERLMRSLGNRVADLENKPQSLTEDRDDTPKFEYGWIINLTVFLVVVSGAATAGYFWRVYGFPPLQMLFWVSVFLGFMSFAPGDPLKRLLPTEISQTTVFWSCLFSATIVATVDSTIFEVVSNLAVFTL